MITAPMLQLTNDAGEAVLILTEGLPRADLLRSRLTRAEVQRQLQCLAETLGRCARCAAPSDARDRLGRLARHAARAAVPGAQQDEALWFAVQSLVPATLSWLRVYRQSHPELFQAWH